MWFTGIGLPAALQTVDDNVDILLARWTQAIADRIDADISSRAAASTALSTSVWTAVKAGYLDQAISAIQAGEVSGETLNSQTFNSNGTFTVPTDFKGFLFVTLIGGGGGGGGYDSSPVCGGGGGGGGAVMWRMPVWVDKAVTSSVSVTIGAGGAAGSGTGDGGSGGDSLFGSFLNAQGGGGGDSDYLAGNAPGGIGGAPLGLAGGIDNFPAYRNFRIGFMASGGSGGAGDDDGTGFTGSGVDFGDLVGAYSEGSNDVPSSSSGGLSTGGHAGGGGGASWGNGGDQAASPAANTGAGGMGAEDDGTPAAQAGAAGKCIVEYWS